MIAETINQFVDKQVAESTKFWAGKPKLTMEELAATENFAKQKGKALENFFSSKENVSNLEAMFQAALKS